MFRDMVCFFSLDFIFKILIFIEKKLGILHDEYLSNA